MVDKDLEKITVNSEEDYDYLNKVLKEFNVNNIKLIKEKRNIQSKNFFINFKKAPYEEISFFLIFNFEPCKL